MKAKTWLFLVLAGWLVGMSTAIAGSVTDRAMALVEKLKEEAFFAVVSARERLRGSEENLQLMRSVEREVAGSGDRTAIQVAQQAVSEGEQGVREAQQLLDRAKLLLVRREQQLLAAKRLGAQEKSKPGGSRAAMLALEGDVKVFDVHGVALGNALRPLQVGDRVMTGEDGRARLILAGGDADTLLESGSDFRITEDSLDGSFQADLKKGFAKIRVRVAHKLRKFEVHTPSGGGAVRGTEFSMHVLPEGMRVGVWEGVVMVSPNDPDGLPLELRAGEQREWTRTVGWGPLQPLGSAPQRVKWGD